MTVSRVLAFGKPHRFGLNTASSSKVHKPLWDCSLKQVRSNPALNSAECAPN